MHEGGTWTSVRGGAGVVYVHVRWVTREQLKPGAAGDCAYCVNRGPYALACMMRVPTWGSSLNCSLQMNQGPRWHTHYTHGQHRPPGGPP